MLVLIPMAGTMTSFGAIKNAVNTTRECRPKEGKFMTVEATVNTNCSEEDMIGKIMHFLRFRKSSNIFRPREINLAIEILEFSAKN